MIKEEALRMALEALEVANSCVDGYYIPKGKTQLPEVEQAITAIREVLAQPEQEPVACHTCKGLGRIYMGCGSWIHCDTCNTTGKATTPPKREWVGLTFDEIDLLEELYAPPVHPDFVNDASHCLELIRHVEAKLKEKNSG